MNHFSVYAQKANLRWTFADYEERAIRPHVLGHFRDLVLGVRGGYTQGDVQELARILTGTGIDQDGEQPALKPMEQALLVRHDGFEFNPARHDGGDKVLLGHPIVGGGLAEIEAAVDIITRQKACARFISRKLAVYFVGDEPPPALVDAMANIFTHTQGDLAAVMRVLLTSRELAGSLGRQFKDPMRFVMSAYRLAYDDRPIANAHPIINALAALGEPLYGRSNLRPRPRLSQRGSAGPGPCLRRARGRKTGGGVCRGGSGWAEFTKLQSS